MATTVICDVCERAPSAGRIRVTLEIENAVAPDTRTGRMEEIDSCEACRAAGLTRLVAQVREILEQHVPAQKELLQLQEQIREHRRVREHHANAAGQLESEILRTQARAETSNDPALQQAERALAENQDHVADVDAKLAPLLERRRHLRHVTKSV